jgi:hypothetical protein
LSFKSLALPASTASCSMNTKECCNNSRSGMQMSPPLSSCRGSM